MKFTRYGITLARLTLNDIELVRKWRNHSEVNRHFEYRKHITADQQIAWFHTINNDQNFFYLVEYKGRPTGVISTFDIDWQAKTAHAGIFMWDVKVLDTHIPVFAVLAMLDLNFHIFGLHQMFIKVKYTNKKAIAYNKGLGYQLLPDQEGKEFQFYSLTSEQYFKKTEHIRRVAQKLSNTQTIVELFSETESLILDKIKNLPTAVQEQLSLKVVVVKE